MYYKVKVKVVTEDDNGKRKKQSEEWLVEAVNVTDVEVIITKEYQGFTGDWAVNSVTEQPKLQGVLRG